MRGRMGALGAALALAGVLLMGLAAAKLYALPDVMQYAVLAPASGADSGKEGADSGKESDPAEQAKDEKKAAASPLEQAVEKLEDDAAALSEAVENLDLSGEAGEVKVSAGNVEEQASLSAAGAHFFDLYFRRTVSGRRFYPEELEFGGAVAVLSDGLAFKLFGGVHAEGRSLVIGEKEYFVVGVVKEDRQAGQPGAYRLYVPLAQAVGDKVALKTLTLSGRPIPGKGAAPAFRETASKWLPGGNFSSAERERAYALIPSRFCVFLAGLFVLWALGRRMAAWSNGAVRSFREKLRFWYPGEIVRGFAGRMLVSLIAFGALVIAVFLLTGLMLEPVRVFTEWVPSNLVDWNEVSGAFWNAQNASSGLIEARTPMMLRARFFGALANMGAIFFLAGASLSLAVRRAAGRLKKTEEPV